MGVMVIAEAGVNHNGDLDLALRLIDAAKAAGADAVKFQTFRAEEIVSRQAAKCDYAVSATGAEESAFEMIRRLEIDEDAHHRLMAHCAQRGIAFLSTPFDIPSVALLADRLKLPLLKLPSGEITNAPLLLAAARTGLPIILSTGMSRLAEVERALGVLAFGYLGRGNPAAAAFAAAWADSAGRALVRQRVTLLHCTTEYPAPVAEVNLRAMDTLAAAFGVRTGFSDHTPGIAVSIAAAARGAAVIEKHFTLDRTLPGPDHQASLEPDELTALVAGIRAAEAALGDGIKVPAPSEVKNIALVRKCLVARTAIAAGEVFTEANLAVKRAGGPLSPEEWWDWLGRPSPRAFAADEAIAP